MAADDLGILGTRASVGMVMCDMVMHYLAEILLPPTSRVKTWTTTSSKKSNHLSQLRKHIYDNN